MKNKPIISLIAAVARNRAIGKNNQLLWHLPEDLKRFKAVTQGHVVVMGSKTFESLSRPLPNRVNVVIAKDLDYQAPGCIVVHTLDDALAEAREHEQEEIFIIGGGSIYAQFLPIADKLYLTLVDRDFEADTFFPAYDNFNKIIFSQPGTHGDLGYTFLELQKE